MTWPATQGKSLLVPYIYDVVRYCSVCIIHVNGDDFVLSRPASLEEFLLDLKYDPRQIVVELNGDIIHRSEYDSITITNDDSIEILHFIGGG